MGFTSWLIKALGGAPEEARLDLLTKYISERERSATLEASCSRYEEQVQFLRSQIEQYQLDERKTREGLLTRMGILQGEKKEAPKQEPRPVSKPRTSWGSVASKLEIDSRERYYKEKIAAIEKKDQESGTEVDEQEKEDIKELAK